MDHGLLGVCIGGSKTEIWAEPQEVQAQGLLNTAALTELRLVLTQ